MSESPWKYFSKEELGCHCNECKENNWHKMDDLTMRLVVQLREKVGFALPVSSGFRCSAHNQKVSNTGPFGPHTTGKALDFKVYGEQAYLLVKAALELGFTGIGVNQKGLHESRIIHTDTLTIAEGFPRPWIWTY